MYCPEHILVNNRFLMLIMYGSADIPKKYVPLSWWLNPLRYEVILRWDKPRLWLKINRGGLWRSRVSNAIFNAKRRFKKQIN